MYLNFITIYYSALFWVFTRIRSVFTLILSDLLVFHNILH